MVMRRINVLEHFDALVAGDELNNSKPSPDIYLLAAKKLGIHPDRCIGK
jgi:HAD superfamily hydrolase (TIGR01509 family)